MPEEISNATPLPTQVLPEDTFPQSKNLRLKLFVLLGILTALAILFITGYFLMLLQQNESSSATIIPTPTTNPESFFEAPRLYPEFEWEEFIESEFNKSLSESALYSQKGNWGSIRMNGEEWTASKDNLDRDSMEVLLTGFDEYYNSELTQRGWSNIYEDEQYNLVPLSADGPGGSIWGYIKVNDGKLRVILLEKFTPIEGFGGVATCPCDIGFRVFVSDVESIEELVKRID